MSLPFIPFIFLIAVEFIIFEPTFFVKSALGISLLRIESWPVNAHFDFKIR